MVGLVRSPGYTGWAVFSERIQIVPDIEVELNANTSNFYTQICH